VTIEQAFGNAVRRLRKERELSQDALALTSMLDRTFISLIECGKKNPTLITIFQLARGLNVSTERILREVEVVMALNGAVPSLDEGVAGEALKMKGCDADYIASMVAKYHLVGTGTVLLVEDEEATRNFIIMLLKRVGYDVLVAVDGQQAIELYGRKKATIALIIMDVVLPFCNGIEAVKKIQEANPEVKVLYISGYAADSLGIQVERQCFLQKPFEPLDFVNTVRECLAQ